MYTTLIVQELHAHVCDFARLFQMHADTLYTLIIKSVYTEYFIGPKWHGSTESSLCKYNLVFQHARVLQGNRWKGMLQLKYNKVSLLLLYNYDQGTISNCWSDPPSCGLHYTDLRSRIRFNTTAKRLRKVYHCSKAQHISMSYSSCKQLLSLNNLETLNFQHCT